MTEPFKPILALDGGGIRGIFTAAFLAHVEKHLQCKIVDHVGLIAGTSTGAIIGLGLACGYSAQEILDAYKEAAPKIFPKKRWNLVRQLWSPKHDNRELIKWLREFFGERALGEAKVPIVIPSIDAEVGQPRVWKTKHHDDLHDGNTKKMWEVALSSTAAPVYFPPVQVDNLGAYIDGGLWANNPSMVGILESQKYLNQPIPEVKLLSLGTGRRKTWLPFDKIKRRGFWGWLGPPSVELIELLLFISSESVENQVKFLLEKENYLRINEDLPDKMALDDISSIGQLENLGVTVGRTVLNRVREFLQIKPSHSENPLQPQVPSANEP